MIRTVITHNEVEGFHRYPNAPEWCAYLANNHRHIFVIECGFDVSHNEREIEINQQQRVIDQAIRIKYGSPAKFGDMSCEAIAEWLLDTFNGMSWCKVTEDGYGGASLTR